MVDFYGNFTSQHIVVFWISTSRFSGVFKSASLSDSEKMDDMMFCRKEGTDRTFESQVHHIVTPHGIGIVSPQ